MPDLWVSRRTPSDEGVLPPDDYVLMLVESGGFAVSDGERTHVRVSPGEGILLQPSVGYVVLSEPDSSALSIGFSRVLFSRYCLPAVEGCPLLNSFFIWDKGKQPTPYLLFQQLDAAELRDAETMLSEFETKAPYYETLLICRLTGLLLQLGRMSWMTAPVTERPGSQLIQQILAYMVSHVRTVTLASLAKQFNYHPNSISAMLKKNTGKSFRLLLRQIRMSRAAELLREGSRTTQQVAEECGYTNMSHFYSIFSNQYGLTPGEYVKVLQTGKEP